MQREKSSFKFKIFKHMKYSGLLSNKIKTSMFYENSVVTFNIAQKIIPKCI